MNLTVPEAVNGFEPKTVKMRLGLSQNVSYEEAALVFGGRQFLQPQATRGHRELIDGLTAPASSESRQSADDDEQQPLMSARYAGTVPCPDIL